MDTQFPVSRFVNQWPGRTTANFVCISNKSVNKQRKISATPSFKNLPNLADCQNFADLKRCRSMLFNGSVEVAPCMIDLNVTPRTELALELIYIRERRDTSLYMEKFKL